jgi:acyl-CoA thioesterase FadM
MWFETYRGAASPWECDITGHFTIAFYFDRIAIAEASLAAQLGLSDLLRSGGFVRRYDVRLVSELHPGSAFHVESAAIGCDGGLRFGHRLVDSVTGAAIAWAAASWDGVAARLPPGSIAAWNGPEFTARPAPADPGRLLPTGAGRVRPGDLDEFGGMDLCGMVHKFSDTAMHSICAIGLTPEYNKTGRRSYSTVELRLRIARIPRLGEAYRIGSGITHLGTTSVHFLHVMSDPEGGPEIARVDRYGVQLDLETRRPAPLAPAWRALAQRLLLATGQP